MSHQMCVLSAVSDSILWESFKVVIRGHIISYQSSLKRARRRRLTIMEANPAELEEDYRNTGSEDSLNSILKIKYEYNHILGEQVGNCIRKLKQKYFELGEKADKLLSRQLKGIQAERAIHKISSSTGQLLTDHKQINDQFLCYYRQLYTSTSNATDAEIADFFSTLDIPVLF